MFFECLYGKVWCDIVSVVGELLFIFDVEVLFYECVVLVNFIGFIYVVLVMGELSVRVIM